VIGKRLTAVFFVAFVAVACGGAAKEARAPEATPNATPAQPAGPPPSSVAAPETATGGSGAASSRELALQRARGELDTARRELDVAASDCRAACRALGSMDRAAGHLCALASVQTDRDQCEDAKKSVRGARDKVRATCGSCPGGPSVDKDAPIPSSP
jgi:hypothetical protein